MESVRTHLEVRIVAQTKADKKTAKKEKRDSAKAAQKALDRAEKAVRKARKAVARSSEELRTRAERLAHESQQLSATHAAATRRGDTPTYDQETENPTPLPTAAPRPRTSVRKVRTAQAPKPSTPTLAELRTQAKERKITGYYRMNKAALLAALTPPPV